MILECMLSSTNVLASFMNSAASSTTEVVPSPTSSSYETDISASALAAGCTILRLFTIVAPSLVIVVEFECISLSIPRGPRVDLTQSAMATHALMLVRI